jgi:NADPH-dependent glutamate synthase beta subunit-like oxidoreductase
LFDKSGRRRPEPISGSEFQVDLDTVISAIGQKAELDFIQGSGIDTGRSAIAVNKDFRTTHAKVWAGGDVVTGPAMVIDAIAAGRKAAQAMDESLRAARGETP